MSYPKAPPRTSDTTIVGHPFDKKFEIELTESQVAECHSKATAMTRLNNEELSAAELVFASAKEVHKQAKSAYEIRKTEAEKMHDDADNGKREQSVKVQRVRYWSLMVDVFVGVDGEHEGVEFDRVAIPSEAHQGTLDIPEPEKPAAEDLDALMDIVKSSGNCNWTIEELQAECELSVIELFRRLDVLVDGGMLQRISGRIAACNDWDIVRTALVTEEHHEPDGVEEFAAPLTTTELTLQLSDPSDEHALTAQRITEIVHAQDGYGVHMVNGKWVVLGLDTDEPAGGIGNG